MLKICTRTLVKVGMGNPCGLVKSCHLVKPVSATLVTGRYVTQQAELPKQPVPPLQQTCERYLGILEPIVEADELQRTKQLVEEFLKGGVGERLQKGLERRARNSENWMTDLIMQFRYLEYRKSVVHSSSVGCSFPRRDFRDKQGQIRCAANTITAVLDLRAMIDNGTFPVEYFKGKPLCMEQYSHMLSSCRIPGLETDSMVFHGKSSNPPKHITVVHNSQFFVVEVYNSDGTPLTVDELCVQLERIYDSSLDASTEPVGILTTLDRDYWGKVYANLIKDKTNKESLSAIERSIFMACLDGPVPQVPSEMHTSHALQQLLNGGGPQWNSSNRWFDKTLQLIFGEDGTFGLNGAHSVTDGTILMALAAYIVAYMEKAEMIQPSTVSCPSVPMPQKLHFNITPDIKKDIEEAKRRMDIISQALDARIMVFDHFGKNFIQDLKISPDGFIQMAIQLASYRMYQQVFATYEAAFLRLFRKGRVGVIPSTSSASAAFAKAFDDPKKQDMEKVDLLEKAIKVHSLNAKLTVDGHSVESHLRALRIQAEEENIPTPDIFTDTSFDKAFIYHLATSQVSSDKGCLPLACPDHAEGYDMVYTVANDHITFIISAYTICKENSPTQLNKAIEEALLDMRALLEQTSTAK